MMASQQQSNIERRLVRAWAKERLVFGARGFLSFVFAVTLLLATDFLLDWGLRLSSGARLWLLAANAVILLGVLYGTWWRSLRKFDALRVALQVEHLYPGLRSLLVSYVQLGDDANLGSASPALVHAMREQAVTQASRFDFLAIVHFRGLKRLALLALAVLVCALGVGFWKSDFACVFLVRISNPGIAVAYPTRTKILSLGGNMSVQQGSTVMLRATVGGRIPEQAVLSIRPEDGEPETMSVAAGDERGPGQREFAYRVAEVQRSFTYSFRVGDDRSEACEVRVIPPPVVEPRVELTFPAYTGRRPAAIETLSFEALEGATIAWHMKVDRALVEAELLLADGQPVKMTLSPDGRTASAELPAEKAFSYGFRWKDRHYGFVYAPDVRYAVKVLADGAPTVVLVEPKQDEKATAQKTLNIAFEANDDYGITNAAIVYTVQKGPMDVAGAAELREPIIAYPEPSADAQEAFVWDVQASVPTLSAGDVIVYAVEVADNRSGAKGANVTRSEKRRLAIVSNEEYVRIAMERRRELLGKVKELHTEEGVAVEAVRKLEDNYGKKPEGGN